MGLLVALLFLLVPLRAEAALPENIPVDVLYDPGNPDASVGIAGDELLEVGTQYENFKVITFEPEAIVLKEMESDDHLKWLKEGEVSRKSAIRAKRLFIVKQMRAIYTAQQQYFEKFTDHFASNINTLIDQGFLPDGFNDSKKRGYIFRIVSTGEGKRLAIEARRQPLFWAIAEPENPAIDRWFFGVDQLGQVRYGRSRREASWGPVWEYNGLNEEPSSSVIENEEEPRK